MNQSNANISRMFNRRFHLWVSCLSLLAFLLTGLSTSVSMFEMSFNSLNTQSPLLASNTFNHVNLDCHFDTFTHVEHPSENLALGHHAPSNGNCCGAACVILPLTLVSPILISEAVSSRLPIFLEHSLMPSNATDTLYRPPIV